MTQLKERDIICLKIESNTICINLSNQLITCIGMASFIEISSQKIFYWVRIMWNWLILAPVEVYIQNSPTPNIFPQGGIEPQNACWQMATTAIRWICGVLDACCLKSFLYFLFSQEMMKLIKYTKYIIFLGRLIRHFLIISRSTRPIWNSISLLSKELASSNWYPTPAQKYKIWSRNCWCTILITV